MTRQYSEAHQDYLAAKALYEMVINEPCATTDKARDRAIDALRRAEYNLIYGAQGGIEGSSAIP